MKTAKDKKKEALVTVALKDFVRRLYFKKMGLIVVPSKIWESMEKDLNNPKTIGILADNLIRHTEKLEAKVEEMQRVLDPLVCYVRKELEQ